MLVGIAVRTRRVILVFLNTTALAESTLLHIHSSFSIHDADGCNVMLTTVMGDQARDIQVDPGSALANPSLRGELPDEEALEPVARALFQTLLALYHTR